MNTTQGLKVRKTNNTEAKAYQYYCMGLNSKEIAKLLDISFRTVQGYMNRGRWSKSRKPGNLKYEALRLHETGASYSDIARRLNISRTSVYLYLKETRTYTGKKAVKVGTVPQSK